MAARAPFLGQSAAALGIACLRLGKSDSQERSTCEHKCGPHVFADALTIPYASHASGSFGRVEAVGDQRRECVPLVGDLAKFVCEVAHQALDQPPPRPFDPPGLGDETVRARGVPMSETHIQ